MLAHYFTVAYRNLLRNRLHALINVVGLALGLMCFVGAYVFVNYSRSFDTQFENSDRIYTLYNGVNFAENDTEWPPYPYVSSLVSEYIDANFPDVEAIVRAQQPFEGVLSVEGRETWGRVKKVDPDFFEMFEVPLVAGDPDPLRQPGSAAITVESAQALYGTADVLGRRILIEDTYDLAIAAVVDDVAGPSHLGTSFLEQLDGEFDVMVRYDFNPSTPELENFSLNQTEFWFGWSVLTHVLFPTDGSLTPEAFTERLQALVDNNLSDDFGTITYELRHVSEFVMWSINQMVFGGRTGMSITTVLLILGGLVLLTAALNFVNLATAQAASRAREVGMRKALGAYRGQVARQYLAEVLMTVALALLLAVVFIQLAMPVVNSSLQTLMGIPPPSDWVFWSALGATVAVVVLGAGLYPAAILGRAQPGEALRAARITGGPRVLRTLLVGVQFTVASFLLIAVLVMNAQNQSLREAGLGLSEDPYVIITADIDDAEVDMEVLGDELRARSAIRGFTGTNRFPWAMFGGGDFYRLTPDETSETVTLESRFVSNDYFSTLNVELLAGRVFSRDVGNDVWEFDEDDLQGFPGSRMRSVPEVNAVIDRTAALQLGWAEPEAAVGQIFYRDMDEDQPVQPVRVVGVVEALPMRVVTWGAPQLGITYFLNPGIAYWPIIRASRTEVATALEQIDAAWDRLAPNYPIKRNFIDENFDRAVSTFENINRLFIGLSVLAFLIASMGLFGMASYLTGRRRREIGIRKSLGAKTREIMRLLVWDFSKPVLIANLVAWPIAFVAAGAYLTLFVDRVALTPVPFVASLVITTGVAWTAVASQVLLAARTKPAEVLRHE